jgi:putative sterol carrier protein
MLYKFPSDEWIKAFMNTLNGDQGKAYHKAAEKWEGDFLFVVEQDEKFPKTIYFYVDLWHGKCREARMITDTGDLPDAEYQYIGTYSNWLKLFERKIDPIKGIMMRKFKLIGNKAKVMRATKAAKELVALTQKIETDFEYK